MRTFANFGIRKKLAVMIGTFATIIAILLLVSFAAINLLSTARALVGAEGLWSKSQKDASYSLVKYMHSGDKADFEKYHHFFKCPPQRKSGALGIKQR